MPNPYICPHCDVLMDVTQEEFSIKGWGSYEVCPSCAEEISTLLDIEEVPIISLFVEHKTTEERHIFDTLESLKSWLANKNEGDFYFGSRKGEWDDRLKRSFIGKGDCGGMIEYEIKEALQTIFLYDRIPVISVALRNKEILTIFCPKTMEDALQQIKQKIGEYPALVSGTYHGAEYSKQDLCEFYSPGNSQRLRRCSDLSGLEYELKNPRSMFETYEITWKTTKEFLKVLLEKVEGKITTLEQRRSDLRRRIGNM
jgi:hypothetical protein